MSGITVREPINGETHVTAEHDTGEWIIVEGISPLEAHEWR